MHIPYSCTWPWETSGSKRQVTGSEAPNMKFRLLVSLSLTDTASVHVWSCFATQHTQSPSTNVLLLSAQFSWLAFSFQLKPWESFYVNPFPLLLCLKGHGYYVLETYPKGLGSFLRKVEPRFEAQLYIENEGSSGFVCCSMGTGEGHFGINCLNNLGPGTQTLPSASGVQQFSKQPGLYANFGVLGIVIFETVNHCQSQL